MDSPQYFPPATPMDDVHFKECLIELLQDMFGEESVAKVMTGDSITITVDNKDARVNLVTMKAECPDDTTFENIVQTAVSKLHQSLVPMPSISWSWRCDYKYLSCLCYKIQYPFSLDTSYSHCPRNLYVKQPHFPSLFPVMS